MGAVIEFSLNGRVSYSYFETVENARQHIAEFWEVIHGVGGVESYAIKAVQHVGVER